VSIWSQIPEKRRNNGMKNEKASASWGPPVQISMLLSTLALIVIFVTIITHSGHLLTIVLVFCPLYFLHASTRPSQTTTKHA
jgi:hypothetical protein